MNNIEELKDLYNRDKDFKEYVDRFMEQTGLPLNDMLKINILQGYGDYIKRENEDKSC